MSERPSCTTIESVVEGNERSHVRPRVAARNSRACPVRMVLAAGLIFATGTWGFAASALADSDVSRVAFGDVEREYWECFVRDRDAASAKALVAAGVDVVLPIVDAVDALPSGARRDALDLLAEAVENVQGRFREIVSDLVARTASDETRWRRRAAVVALRDHVAVDARIGTIARALTSDPDPIVRTGAVGALAVVSTSVAGPGPDDRSLLCAAVTDPSRRVRSEAVEALWFFPAPAGGDLDEVVASFWRLVEIGDADERVEATTWIASTAPGHPSNRARFESMLESDDDRLRRIAMAGLLRGGALDPAMQSRLRGIVADEGRGISGRDFRGEAEYFERLESAGIDPVDWVRREHPDDVDWLLAAGGHALRTSEDRESAYEMLLHAMELESSGGCTSGCAVSKLRDLPSSCLAMVAPRLDHERDMVRIRALEVVAGSRPPTAEAARLLASRLRMGSDFERERALRGLTGLGAVARDALPELCDVYASGDLEDYDRARILECAASIASDASTEWLRGELENPNLSPRLAAIALGGVVAQDGAASHRDRIARLLDSGSDDAARTLYTVLAEQPETGGAIVAERLSRIASDPEQLERELDNGLGDAILAAGLPASQVVPTLAWRLRDKRGLLDWNVLDVLSAYGADAREAIPDLIAAFDVDPAEDEDGMERTSIAVALAAIDPEEGIARLTDLVDSADPAIDAETLVDGLRETGRPEAIDPLMRLFHHRDPDVSESAALALIELRADPEAILPRVAEAIDRGAYDFPYEVVERMGEYGADAACIAPWLLESLRADTISRIPGALAAAEILAGTKRVPSIFDDLVDAAIREDDYAERAWTMYARARVAGEEDRLPSELEALVDESPVGQHEVMLEMMLEVIERLGPREAAFPLLERIASDPTHPEHEAAGALLAAHRAELARANPTSE